MKLYFYKLNTAGKYEKQELQYRFVKQKRNLRHTSLLIEFFQTTVVQQGKMMLDE